MEQRYMDRVLEHASAYQDDTFVMIGLQGSQNYGLDTEFSDVDTKMLVVPTFKDLVRNHQPVSTTKILPNDEHCNLKDVRAYWGCLRKQNINFVELLFTDYFYVNDLYKEPWGRLIEAREGVARYDTHAAVKCMKGMALEKRKALTHPYPAKEVELAKFGYDPKQLHHIIRLLYFMENYTNGESYQDCLLTSHRDYLKKVKINGGGLTVEQAEATADAYLEDICNEADRHRAKTPDIKDKYVENLLDETLEEILTIAFRKELKL